jgi:unsaturated chondroitin disaccharide hydrolase
MCNTSFIRSAGLITALAISLVAGPAAGLDRAMVERDFSFAHQQLEATASQLPETEFPESTRSNDGAWDTRENTDLIAWVQGFFPGELWLMYGRTGNPAWRMRADQWTRALEIQKTNTLTHDLGFKFFLSFGHAYRLTGDPYYRDVLLTAAGSLASRYSSKIGAINCCDWEETWHFPVFLDTMMNLELLLWAAANGGQVDWRDMAIHHADRTAADIVRADGSTYHIADYDPVSGVLLHRGTFQGYSDDSTWARGQAWAMYGYTMVYRYTRARRFLTLAQRTTD